MADEKEVKKTKKPDEGGKAKSGGKGKEQKAGYTVGDVAPAPKGYVPRLAAEYKAKIAPGMLKEKGFPNLMAVPRLTKVSINMGIGEAKSDVKILDEANYILGMISGQKPVPRRSKKSISNFKLREGVIIGLSVTLRGPRMYEFLDRFINLALPRVRDFAGVDPNAFDGRGNYTLGMRDPLIFPEIDYNAITRPLGMNITVVTTAKTDADARELLTRFGMPFRKTGAAAA